MIACDAQQSGRHVGLIRDEIERPVGQFIASSAEKTESAGCQKKIAMNIVQNLGKTACFLKCLYSFVVPLGIYKKIADLTKRPDPLFVMFYFYCVIDRTIKRFHRRFSIIAVDSGSSDLLQGRDAS